MFLIYFCYLPFKAGTQGEEVGESLNWSRVQISTLCAIRYYTFLLQVYSFGTKKKKSREGILDGARHQSWKSKSLFHSTLHNK